MVKPVQMAKTCRWREATESKGGTAFYVMNKSLIVFNMKILAAEMYGQVN